MLEKQKICEYIPWKDEYYNIISTFATKNIQKIEEVYKQMNKKREPPSNYYLAILTNGGDYDESYNSIQSRHKRMYATCTAIKGSYDEDLECSVTVKNDDSLFDGQGFIHTWLIIDGKEGTKLTRMLFSFSNDNIWGIVAPSGGISSACKELFFRPPTQSLTFPTDETKYIQLKAAVKNFYEKNPQYQLISGDKRNVYNCVTASNEILHAVGIDILANVHDPRDVAAVLQSKQHS